MYFLVFDADNNLRFQGGIWPMACLAMGLVISEGVKDGRLPRLLIGLLTEADFDD